MPSSSLTGFCVLGMASPALLPVRFVGGLSVLAGTQTRELSSFLRPCYAVHRDGSGGAHPLSSSSNAYRKRYFGCQGGDNLGEWKGCLRGYGTGDRHLKRLGIVALSADFQSGAGTPSGKKGAKKIVPSKLGYHPLEELPAHVKGKGFLPGEGQLTPAEVARTLAETTEEVIIFASVVADEDSVLGTDAPYFVDHNGDFYLELNNDDDFLRNLEQSQSCSVLIGFGKLDDVSLSELIEEVEEGEGSESSNDGGDSDSLELPEVTKEDLEYWSSLFPGGLREMLESFSPESMGSLGAWGGPETLHWVHPMEFADRLREAATTDYAKDMDFPRKRLTVTGVLRRATDDEIYRVRDFLDGSNLPGRYDSSDANFSIGFETEETTVEFRSSNTSDSSRTEASDTDQPDMSRAKGIFRDGMWLGEPINENARRIVSEVEQVGGSDVNDTQANRAAEDDDDAEIVQEAEIVGGLGLGRDEATSAQDGIDSFHAEGLEEFFEERGMGSQGEPTLLSEAEAEVEVLGELKISTDAETGEQVLTFKNGHMEITTPSKKVIEELLGISLEDIDEGDGSVVRAKAEEVQSVGASLYKLEILSIQLDSTSGVQESIDPAAWSAAKPDMLAREAVGIVERANSLDRARSCMVELCLREHNMVVDEVYMVGIDHLGIDLRVRCGIEMSTLRFPFRYPAMNERAAEKLLDELLRPRKQQPRVHLRKSRQPKKIKGRYRRAQQ